MFPGNMGSLRDALAAGMAGAGPGGPAPDTDDSVCPTCGASCKKIEAAAGSKGAGGGDDQGNSDNS